MKKRIGSTIGGAVGTALIPLGYGVTDWHILAGAAAAGAVGGFLGVDVAGMVKKRVGKGKQ